MKERILVLDDESSILEILGQHLGEESYDCTLMTSATEAIKKLESESFDLLITDLKMPEMHGIEVVRRASEACTDLAVIVVTALLDVTNAIEAMRAGADDYLLKPFNLAEITLSVQKALERRRLVIENRAYQNELEKLVQERANEVKKTKDYLESLLESTLDAIVTIDADRKIIYANGGATKLFGVSSEQLVGQPFERLFFGGGEEAMHVMRLLEEHGQVKSYETEAMGVQDQAVPVNISLSQVDASDGDGRDTLLICKDITAPARVAGRVARVVNQRQPHQSLQSALFL